MGGVHIIDHTSRDTPQHIITKCGCILLHTLIQFLSCTQELHQGTLGYSHTRTVMAVQSLVHGEVTRGRQSLQGPVFVNLGLQFEYLQHPSLSSTRDVALHTVPCDARQTHVVRDGDLHNACIRRATRVKFLCSSAVCKLLTFLLR